MGKQLESIQLPFGPPAAALFLLPNSLTINRLCNQAISTEKNMRILLLLWLLLSSTAFAQTPDVDSGSQPSSFAQDYQLTEILKDINEGRVEKRKLIIIYNILRNTSEVYIHQQRGQYGNQVFVSEDGHMEAVFGPDGKLVQDGINDGSFNFFHPINDPLGHFIADMLPWIYHGTSMNDPTSIEERIHSYVSDLEGGIRQAYSQRKSLVTPEFDETELEVLALYLSIIQTGDADILFTLFDKGANLDDEVLLGALKGIEQGMKTIFATVK